MDLVQMPRQQGKTTMIARALFRDMEAIAIVATTQDATILSERTWHLFVESGNRDVTTLAEIRHRIFPISDLDKLDRLISQRKRALLPAIHVDEIEKVLMALLRGNVGLVTYSPPARP